MQAPYSPSAARGARTFRERILVREAGSASPFKPHRAAASPALQAALDAIAGHGWSTVPLGDRGRIAQWNAQAKAAREADPVCRACDGTKFTSEGRCTACVDGVVPLETEEA